MRTRWVNAILPPAILGVADSVEVGDSNRQSLTEVEIVDGARLAEERGPPGRIGQIVKVQRGLAVRSPIDPKTSQLLGSEQ